ncbi:Phosphatidylinositol anchor biosynthesis protein PIGW-GWT1 [Babesia duncani]|uniref:Phosphatidylinositol anchor biosynthesis protein PIGW-GWT1 n=1 Tax=Babesia duncani TaxID=323732 RepID=A0AAD9PME9_9APIC|nr:Phosphatidylinositol anchor biosynthesis protein PIGW-GWT1 [Babesia duncani]
MNGLVVTLIFYSRYQVPFTLFLLAIWVLVFWFYDYKFELNWDPWKKLTTESGQIRYITWTRGVLTVGTIIAIFAVDGIYFNRLHAKTFFNGYSSMDIGTGGFTYHAGVLMGLSRGHDTSLWLFLKRNSVLLALGIARFIATSWTDYNVPVEEYGIHWNFFISLAVSRALTEMCLKLPKIFSYCIPPIVIIAFESLVVKYDLATRIRQLPRTDIFTANKEGLISIPNYFTICILGYHMGKISKYLYLQGKFKETAIVTAGGCCLASFISWIMNLCGLNSSRTLCNARFVFNTVSVANFTLVPCLFLDVILKDEFKQTPICEMVGKYSLHIFLAANLAMGCFNLLFQSQLLPWIIMLTVVTLYAWFSFGLAYLLYNRRH